MLDLDEEQSNEIAVQPNSSPFCPATATSEENSYFEPISLISGTQQGQITEQLSLTPPAESNKRKRSRSPSPFCPATAISEETTTEQKTGEETTNVQKTGEQTTDQQRTGENSYFEPISLISGTQQGQITEQLSLTPPAESTKIKRSLCHEYSQINSLSPVLPEKRKRKIRQVTNL